jgi:hypothetical protein
MSYLKTKKKNATLSFFVALQITTKNTRLFEYLFVFYLKKKKNS